MSFSQIIAIYSCLKIGGEGGRVEERRGGLSNIITSIYLKKEEEEGGGNREIGGIGRGRRDDIGILMVNEGKGRRVMPFLSKIGKAGRQDFDTALEDCKI